MGRKRRTEGEKENESIDQQIEHIRTEQLTSRFVDADARNHNMYSEREGEREKKKRVTTYKLTFWAYVCVYARARHYRIADA